MRKKFTMLFAALLACAGVVKALDVPTEGIYEIKHLGDDSSSRGYLVQSTSASTLHPAEASLSGYTGESYCVQSRTADGYNSYWYLYTSEGGNQYIFSVTDGKFISYTNGTNSSTLVTLSDEPAQFAVETSTKNSSYYQIRPTDQSTCIGNSIGWGVNVAIRFNEASDDGVPHAFVSVSSVSIDDAVKTAAIDKITALESTEVELTYVYKYGETTWGTETVTATKGEAYPTPATIYGATCTTPEGTVPTDVEAGTEVEITCTLDGNLPFEYAADYASIEHWYYMNIHGDGYYLNYVADATSMTLSATSVPSDSKDAYTWAFVGNPFTGYQIVNYAAGETMILSSSTNTADRNTGGSTYPVMTTTPVAEGNNTYWIPTASSNRTNGFYLAQAGYTSNRMNKRGSYLAYWTGGADSGSTFVVEERPMGAAAELAALLETAKVEVGYVGTAVGNYTQASVDALNTAITTAEAVTEATESDVAALQSAIDALAIVLPEEGKFYTLNSVSYASESRTAYLDATNGMWHNNGADASHVFEFVLADGAYYLKSVERGTYVSNAPGHNGGQIFSNAESVDAAKSVSITRTGGSDRNVNITTNGGAMIHAAGWGNNYQVLGWNNSEVGGASSWLVNDADVATIKHLVSIDEYKYMTLCLNYAVTIPEGVKAYAVTGVDAETNELVMEEISSIIPANEAVIVYAETAADYTFTYTSEAGTKPASNLMKGSLYDKYVTPEGTPYVMTLNANNELVMGMAKVKDDGTILNRANKAYLDLPGASEAAMFSFNRGEGTTAIDNAQLTIDNELVIYDLAGRRVQKMDKGIYIVNGKKVIR